MNFIRFSSGSIFIDWERVIVSLLLLPPPTPPSHQVANTEKDPFLLTLLANQFQPEPLSSSAFSSPHDFAREETENAPAEKRILYSVCGQTQKPINLKGHDKWGIHSFLKGATEGGGGVAAAGASFDSRCTHVHTQILSLSCTHTEKYNRMDRIDIQFVGIDMPLIYRWWSRIDAIYDTSSRKRLTISPFLPMILPTSCRDKRKTCQINKPASNRQTKIKLFLCWDTQ